MTKERYAFIPELVQAIFQKKGYLTRDQHFNSSIILNKFILNIK